MCNMKIKNDNDNYSVLYEFLGNKNSYDMQTRARQIDANKNASILKYQLKRMVDEVSCKYA